MLRRFLLSVSILACSASLSLAEEQGDNTRLKPRFETGLKYGTERSLGTGEVWVPIDQGPDRVLYGNLRLIGDDQDNSEGNLGLGYRQIVDAPLVGQTVAGIHGWIDRRHTDHENNFHQATIGAELLGHDLDARINAYLPLNDEKSYRTPNIGNASPYLAGSGIYYDTAGTGIEEPQPGIDLELGYRLPVLEDKIEAMRLYGGLYHFEGDQTEDVSGWRTRLVADVTPAVSVGGRFQRDDERESQGFLEATIRFPFNAKKSFRTEGLRARLDESPERDVDIVAGSKITDTGLAKPVLSAATGEQQRVLHVDNTATSGGDGSKENPFNQLKLAEAALKANDVIYVHHGDGTTTGQDLGIVIDKPNVSLIGSGADFIYDAGRFTTDKGSGFNGIVLAEATTAPVITNTEVSINNFTGNGVSIYSDNTLVSGLVVNDTTGSGIYADSSTGTHWNNIYISNNITRNNENHGIFIQMNSSTIDNAIIKLNHVENNAARGIGVYATNGSIIERLDLMDNTSNGHLGAGPGGIGINVTSNASQIHEVALVNNVTNDNAFFGTQIYTYNGGSIENLLITGQYFHRNDTGLHVLAQSGGTVNAVIQDSIFLENTYGFRVNDDTTETFIIDLGYGALNSSGRNSFISNTNADLRLDLDGSLTPLPAQGNWWGQSGGPSAGQIVSEGAGSPPAANTGTADTSNALNSDPNL